MVRLRRSSEVEASKKRRSISLEDEQKRSVRKNPYDQYPRNLG
jgi:hypothetical protein